MIEWIKPGVYINHDDCTITMTRSIYDELSEYFESYRRRAIRMGDFEYQVEVKGICGVVSYNRPEGTVTMSIELYELLSMDWSREKRLLEEIDELKRALEHERKKSKWFGFMKK